MQPARHATGDPSGRQGPSGRASPASQRGRRSPGEDEVHLDQEPREPDRQTTGTLEETYDLQLQTGKAWAYKEMLRDLWSQDDAASATAYFKDWYKRVIHTKLAPMKPLARTIKERLANVVSFCTHGITNAVAEGMNSKIMSIKRRVGGYRNPDNFKTAIYFYCGGLSLHPQ